MGSGLVCDADYNLREQFAVLGLGTKFTEEGQKITVFTNVEKYTKWIKKKAKKFGSVQTIGNNKREPNNYNS